MAETPSADYAALNGYRELDRLELLSYYVEEL
jgi:hypothetical protein